MATAIPTYEKSVFINCPFDKQYARMHEAIVFTVKVLGFEPRSARELDGGEARINKIMDLIGSCRYGIHDISRTQLDSQTRTPRFDMPFELGLDLGCKRFGGKKHRDKCLTIFDIDDRRFRIFLSDLSGQDPKGHNNQEDKVIGLIRDWLATANRHLHFPSSDRVVKQYNLFKTELPGLCRRYSLKPKDLSFVDYVGILQEWGGQLLPRFRTRSRPAARR